MDLATARAAAHAFVLGEAGFAQVTTIDSDGFPVSRTMTAFLEPDWSVSLVQRAGHRRLEQWRRDPHTLVTWVGSPAPGATNERPHVFDIGLVPPRMVAIRGTASVMPAEWTIAVYRREVARQRASGFTKAPVRSADEVSAELAGVRIEPVRVRLEGFGVGAESHLWTIRKATT
ncbi:hypothetical protein GA0070607_0134 [Micromonospora coriariae]|uniref:Pyridoxamine 5'-phosphate oxidase n=1 Tax=Micromonospora coriariae TaxID=285665 RepID=A0A1C4U4C9_9ACTN|nr:hypothetical protein [Micromonospora coriariae]SCE66565.1 hypothetical protein GA0070607_0134 [Micromonospora coriariae]